MLKKLLLSVLAFACLAPAYAQHKRRVLIEEFTNASCPPCASQNPTFNATIAANIDYLTPLKYQAPFPGYDPMNEQNPAEVATRLSYYNVDGVPNGRQNGTLEVFPMTAYNKTTILAAYNTTTPVTITLSHAFSADYDSILLQVDVKSETELTGALRLHVAVMEENINFDAPPGSTNEKDFSYVMRKMLPNAAGTTTGDFAAGETKSYSFAWPVAYAYDMNELGAVAWLQTNDTKEVYQSAISFPTGDIPTIQIAVPNSFSFNCTSGVSPVLTLTNTSADSNLTSATLRYRVNGGAWVEYVWSGDLAPNNSTEVELTDVVITDPSLTKVDVELVRSNHGVQTHLIDVISTVSVRTLPNVPAAFPFAHNFQAVIAIPAEWTVYNADVNGWKLSIAGGTNFAARCRLFKIPEGLLSYLTTPKIDLTTAAGPTSLRFDHAYTYYQSANGTFFDSLRVEVSADCGATWTTVFHDGKDGLATVAPKSSEFSASATSWRTNQIDLTAFNGGEVLIRFIAESGFGNNMYIDNVNVSLTTGVKELPLTEFTLAPNPSPDAANLRFSLTNPGAMRLMVFNATGALVQSRELGELAAGTHNFRLDPAQLTNGTYRVVLQGNDGVAQTQWIVLK